MNETNNNTDTLSEEILRVENLTIAYNDIRNKTTVNLTDGVSFSLRAGEIYGLVGESGCGKTVSSLAILRLLPVPVLSVNSGKIFYRGQNVLDQNIEDFKKIRGKKISMIFQEPGISLNPLYTIEKQLLEIFEFHEYNGNRRERVLELLNRSGIADPIRVMRSFPHELSGGMLQRVMISLALLFDPDVLIADEPTTSLDVTVQAQIMELLTELQREKKMSVLLITHNMGLIAGYADRVAVMYAGRIVEESPVKEFLEKPMHPYSRGLINAIPDIRSENAVPRPIPGTVPEPKNFPAGCRFLDRCPGAYDKCREKPDFININQNHRVACFSVAKEFSEAQ